MFLYEITNCFEESGESKTLIEGRRRAVRGAPAGRQDDGAGVAPRTDTAAGADRFPRAGQRGDLCLRVGETGVRVESGGDYGEPLLEVRGDPRRIQAILRGEKDARKQFFAGGIRVRGDMHYLSELGMRLGFLKTPII